MSELKAYTFSNMEGRGLAEYYLKSEADKVIAELKEERDWLAKDRAQAYDDLEKRAQLNIKQEESIRHHKYKRCLAMAKACDKYAFALELQGQGRSTELLKRHNRAIERKYKWLELADKFKECMNA